LSATSATTVDSGALLGGTGSLANGATIKGNATISPGIDSVGTLSLGSLTIENTGIYLAGITGNMQSDKLNVTGNFNFDGVLKVVLGSYVPVAGDMFDVADFSGTVTGNWTLDTSLAGLTPGLNWDSSLFASQGLLQIVPEPSTSLLGLAGAVALMRRRRR
ncbi:MAG: PEP-CTERM sorting domain-containing protein, partial [Verrucomicrobiaceae bacterium]